MRHHRTRPLAVASAVSLRLQASWTSRLLSLHRVHHRYRRLRAPSPLLLSEPFRAALRLTLLLLCCRERGEQARTRLEELVQADIAVGGGERAGKDGFMGLNNRLLWDTEGYIETLDRGFAYVLDVFDPYGNLTRSMSNLQSSRTCQLGQVDIRVKDRLNPPGNLFAFLGILLDCNLELGLLGRPCMRFEAVQPVDGPNGLFQHVHLFGRMEFSQRYHAAENDIFDRP